MEGQALQGYSLGSFTVVGLWLNTSILLKAPNIRGCARWLTKNMQCKSPGRLHYPSDIKLCCCTNICWLHRWGGQKQGKGWGTEKEYLLQIERCVIKTCFYPKATTALVQRVGEPSFIPTAHRCANISCQVKAKEQRETGGELTAYLEEKGGQKRAGAELRGCAISPRFIPVQHRQEFNIQPASPPLRLS